jgi:hypothetical protein
LHLSLAGCARDFLVNDHTFLKTGCADGGNQIAAAPRQALSLARAASPRQGSSPDIVCARDLFRSSAMLVVPSSYAPTPKNFFIVASERRHHSSQANTIALCRQAWHPPETEILICRYLQIPCTKHNRDTNRRFSLNEPRRTRVIPTTDYRRCAISSHARTGSNGFVPPATLFSLSSVPGPNYILKETLASCYAKSLALV